MNWLVILPKIFEVVIVPLLGLLTTYLIKFIKTKSTLLIAETNDANMRKYLNMLSETVISCVITTNQTYVDSLKKAGAFDKEAQKQAFQYTYDAVMQILTEDAKNYLEQAVGDLEVYLKNKIESEVNANKT